MAYTATTAQTGNIWIASPEYLALFSRYPEQAAATLRGFKATGSHKLISLLLAFPAQPTIHQWQAMFDTGFSSVLLEILLDESTYKWIAQSEDSNNGESARGWILMKVMACLQRFTSRWDHQPEHYPAAFQELTRGLPALWALLWRYRRSVLGPKFMASTSGMLELVANLLRDYIGIYRAKYQTEPPVSSHAGHLTLYLWLHLGGVRVRTYALAELTVGIFANEPDADRRVWFAKDAVTGSIGSEPLADIIWRVLVLDEELLGFDWYHTLQMINIITMVQQPLGEFLCKRKGLLLAVATAYRRQVCLDDSGEITADLAAQGTIGTLHGLFAIAAQEVIDELFNNISELNFIHLLAQTIVQTFSTRELMALPVAILRILTNFGKQFCETPHCSEQLHLEYDHVQLILRHHWLPTLDKLHEAHHASSQTPHRERQGGLSAAIEMWVDLGRVFGLTESVERSEHTEGEIRRHVSATQRYMGCSYSDCDCHGCKPLHRQMRVCRGCWVVRYCGPRCQERDWASGHKEVCSG